MDAAPMSQSTVETILGRLITDEDFRAAFFAEPQRACRQHAFDVTEEELAALRELDHLSLDAVAGCLEDTIVRGPGASLEPSRTNGRGRR